MLDRRLPPQDRYASHAGTMSMPARTTAARIGAINSESVRSPHTVRTRNRMETGQTTAPKISHVQVIAAGTV
ncbi:hypothetical protein OY671_012331, partial [Metschnikowia pulcherrima]